jgi:hypothetical protein
VLEAPDDAAGQTILDAGWDQADNYHNNDWEGYCRGMVEKLVPSRALAKVKRHLRQHCCKPADMSVHQYYQNLYRINNEEIPNLPTFGALQNFREDEFIDIILYRPPGSWAQEMEQQGFDPMDHTAEEVVAFMEQLESAESHEKTATKVEAKKSDKSSPKRSQRKVLQRRRPSTVSSMVTELIQLRSAAPRTSATRPTSPIPRTATRTRPGNTMLMKRLLLTRKSWLYLSRRQSRRKSPPRRTRNASPVKCLSKPLDGFNYKDMENLNINDD